MRGLLIAVMLALAVPAVVAAQPDSQGEPRGRSGFWTNPNPAVGGSYRWRLLAVGIGLAALAGGGMLVLIRRANAQRAARDENAKQTAGSQDLTRR